MTCRALVRGARALPRASGRAARVLGVHALAACAIPQGAAAQADMPVSRFIVEARAATQRYQRPQAAIADGFKRVGVEFPAMGEHWVSLQRVMEDTLLPSRPSVLIYTTVRGETWLAGVGYTALLDPGEQPPAYRPAAGYWHEHNGSVAEESLPGGHGAHAQSHGRGGGGGAVPPIRLAILHAWIWTENPEGVFVTDNWALPGLRVGARPGVRHARAVLRGMALASDDEGYYVQTITTRALLTAAEQSVAARIVDAHRAKARASLARGAAAAPTGEVWKGMWAELARALPTRAVVLRALEQEL